MYQGEGKKGSIHQPLHDTSSHMGSRLHAEKGCRKVNAGEVFEQQTNLMEAK